VGAALAVAAAAACAADATSDAPSAVTAPRALDASHGAHGAMAPVAVTPGHRQAAEQVRRATAAFTDLAAAKAAGYTVQYPAGCAYADAGAQGVHWLNESLVDHHVNLLTPELLMYEPQPDGSMVLVGVDYVIPFDAWKSPQPPRLLGVPMMRNEGLRVWALHIWAQRENPSGLFAPWNPTVQCPESAD
jgi:hypothetical protein